MPNVASPATASAGTIPAGSGPAPETSRPPAADAPAVAPLVMAYVLLWFPLSSETFIFREIVQLREQGLDIHVNTLCDSPVRCLGMRAFFRIWGAFFRALRRRPGLVLRLLREGFFRRMRNLESLGENLWCFMAGFLLAECCRRDKVELIHSSWANGPATAAWVASRLTGIPFAFTGRAGDIYPEDGLLREKSRDALFIRTNNAANAPLQQAHPHRA